MKEYFLKRIEECKTLDELDYIVEQASNEISSNADYDKIYIEAMNKAKSWL